MSRNVSATNDNDFTVRIKARAIRKIFGYENVQRISVLELLEHKLCAPGTAIDFVVVSKDELPDSYAITNPITKTIKIREDVYERAAENVPRDRFTICHEIGHLFLHQPEFIEFARGRVPIQHDPEHQANVFAAELLAPLDMIKNFTVDEVSERFGISKQSASIQLQNADMLRVGNSFLA